MCWLLLSDAGFPCSHRFSLFYGHVATFSCDPSLHSHRCILTFDVWQGLCHSTEVASETGSKLELELSQEDVVMQDSQGCEQEPALSKQALMSCTYQTAGVTDEVGIMPTPSEHEHVVIAICTSKLLHQQQFDTNRAVWCVIRCDTLCHLSYSVNTCCHLLLAQLTCLEWYDMFLHSHRRVVMHLVIIISYKIVIPSVGTNFEGLS